MMVTTHGLVGLLVGLAAAAVGWLPPPVAAMAGFAGGVVPDLDLYAGHRRTLHYPVLAGVAAAAAVLVAWAFPAPLTAAAAVAVTAAALHAVMDAAGGGLQLRPWRGTSDRAVYDHVRGRWLRPRRWVRYDGAPEDLVVAASLAVPSVLFYPPAVRRGVLVVLAASGAYAAVRRRLPALGATVHDALPASVVSVLPADLVADMRTAADGHQSAGDRPAERDRTAGDD